MLFHSHSLRTLRETRGLTRDDVARALQSPNSDHIHPTALTVGYWEDGHGQPTLEEVEKLASFFGVPAAQLLHVGYRPDSVAIPRSSLRTLENALSRADAVWALGFLQGVVSGLGDSLESNDTLCGFCEAPWGDGSRHVDCKAAKPEGRAA